MLGGNLTSSFLTSIASRIADTANSYIYQGTSIASSRRPQPYELSNYENYYQFLELYHFVEAMLNIICTTASEAIENTPFNVSVPGDKDGELSKLLSDCFNKLRIKEVILNDIRQHVYRGKYIYSIDLNNMKLNRFIDPYSFKVVEKSGTIVGSVYQNKFINSQECLSYYYIKYNESPVARNKVKTEGISELNKYASKDKSLSAKYIVDYNIFEGKSIFLSQLLKIYQMYVLEYALYFLGLRESIRPDIISMTLQASRKDTGHATNAAQKIEALLNQPAGMVGQIQDPVAFINELTYSLLNNIKVVPNVDNYMQIGVVDLPDSTAKREKLKSEKDDLMNQILANLGIPTELYLGQSNRWEVMSRNDRFLTLIRDILSSESRLVKQLSSSILLKYTGKKYNPSDLTFNLESNNYMSTFMKQQRLQNVASRLQNTDMIIQTYDSWMRNEGLNKDNIKQYFAATCANADSNLLPLLGIEVDTGNDEFEERKGMHIVLPDLTLTDDGTIKSDNESRRNLRPLIDTSMLNNNGIIETVPDFRGRRNLNPHIADITKLGEVNVKPHSDQVRTDSRSNLSVEVKDLENLNNNINQNVINEVRRK